MQYLPITTFLPQRADACTQVRCEGSRWAFSATRTKVSGDWTGGSCPLPLYLGTSVAMQSADLLVQGLLSDHIYSLDKFIDVRSKGAQ